MTVRPRRPFSRREGVAILVCSLLAVLGAGYAAGGLLRAQDAERFGALFDAAHAHYVDVLGRAQAALTTIAALDPQMLDGGGEGDVVARILAANPVIAALYLADRAGGPRRSAAWIADDDPPVDPAAGGAATAGGLVLRRALSATVVAVPATVLAGDDRVVEALRRSQSGTTTAVLSDRFGGAPRIVLLRDVGHRRPSVRGILVMVLDPGRAPPAAVDADPRLSLVLRADAEPAGNDGAVLFHAGSGGRGALAWVLPPVSAVRELSNGGVPMSVEGRLAVVTDGGSWAVMALSMSLAALLCTGLAELWRRHRVARQALRISRRTMRRHRAMAEATLEAIGDGVITADPDGSVTYMNPVAERMIGMPFAAARGQRLANVVRLRDEQTGESPLEPAEATGRLRAEGPMTLTPGSGPPVAVEAARSLLRDPAGESIGSVVVIRDVSHERRLTRELAFQANHDRLTGLHNRFAFERRLAAALAAVREGEGRFTICFLDLDDFKQVNDSCGHQAGDQVLGQVGALLRRQVRENDLLARLGGDEFAIVLDHCNVAQARDTAERIRRSLSRAEFRWQGRLFRIGVSIGLLALDQRFGSIAEVMQAADSACYAAKSAGRNRIHVYDASRDHADTSVLETQWARIIHDAIGDGRFVLLRQIVRPLQESDQLPPMAELLVEMQTGNEGVIKPRQLISSARRFGLAARIDRHVVELALKGIVEDDGGAGAVYSVNITAQTLAQPDFAEFAANACRAAGVASARLCFEIGEREAIAGYALIERTMTELRDAGFLLAIDEFGSGWGAVSCLENFAVDYVKIAGHLCRDVSRDPVRRAMVSTVTDIARVFGMRTVAKHVEDPEVLRELRALGVDYAQGFAIQHPLPFYGRSTGQARAAVT